ncbi:Polycystic kidney disease [Mactra antiquata]
MGKNVEVNNGISSLTNNYKLTVVLPIPRDLQVWIEDEADLPSCIPEEYGVLETNGQIFSVFVGTQLLLSAGVSMGTNMTFIFDFEDMPDKITKQPCDNCTSVSVVHTFEDTGIYSLKTVARNSYGRVTKSVRFIVMDRQLHSLDLVLDSKSSLLGLVDEPLHFIVSMVTTSRYNHSLQVWYGDNFTNIVSLADTDSPKLVLKGDGKEMDIGATYGEGCTLVAEFQHAYSLQGYYNPSVAVYRDIAEDESYYEVPENASEIQHILADQSLDTEPDLLYMLNSSILILQDLTEVRIQAPSILACTETAQIQLLLSTRLNISISWVIYKVNDKGDADMNTNSEELEREFIESLYDSDIIFKHYGNDVSLNFTLNHSGLYVVKVEANNAITSVENQVEILVQCPIEGLEAICQNDVIAVGKELTCYAQVDQGSDLEFQWLINGMESDSYVESENMTSKFIHKFTKTGIYDVELIVSNSINRTLMSIQPSIYVESVISNIKVLLEPTRNKVGRETALIALYKKPELVTPPVRFVWDFGEVVGKMICDEEECFELCYEHLCWNKVVYMFEMTGVHSVTVHAYNHVSNFTKDKDIAIYPGLDDVFIDVVNVPTANSFTRFLVKEYGKAMETADVYFTWDFGESSTVYGEYYTNSPIVEVYFNSSGNLSVFVQITNPVDKRYIEVPVYVRPSEEQVIELLHDLYVTPHTEVTFELKVNIKEVIDDWTQLYVTYEDGVSEVYNAINYQWKHVFVKVGTQQVTATFIRSDGSTIDSVSSYIVIQEPITDLTLTGPSMLIYENYATCEWIARTSTGTNILYNWTLENVPTSVLLTIPEYEIDIPYPGGYILHVEAFNDVTRQPLTASFPFVVHNVTNEDKLNVKLQVQFQIIGNLIGESTHLHINVTGHPEFVLEINYGDGESEIIHSSDPVVIAMGTFNFRVFSSHVFSSPDIYNITVNASNDISWDIAMETFIPISNITLTTRSPWILRTMSRVTVQATVTGGENLAFRWNFSDPFQKPNSTRTNRTSIATHSYGMSGTYHVTCNVTGRNYPPPGVYMMLDRSFHVVDPIENVKLYPSQSSASLIDNITSPILFTAKSSGSHVTFIFEYGDGIIEEIAGSQLSHMNVDMTMYADGMHTYTSVGEYKVKVTAKNPLGKKTAELAASFWVQVPPTGLHFCGKKHKEVFSYSGEVGTAISMCVQVVSGTNVTFDWKLGDQTDLIKRGSMISHQYMSPGDRNVYVTAYNHVHSETIKVKVHVNYEIQSVKVVPEVSVISMGKLVRYVAIVTPNMTAKYKWIFRPSYKSHKTFSTIQNYVQFVFLYPGESTVTVLADNYISRVYYTLDVFVHQPIKRSEIVIGGNNTYRLVNQPIILRHYAYYRGTDVNLTWTFGDDSDKIITNNRTIEYTYYSPGAYNVTLIAQNPVSIETVHRMLFILDQPYCIEPKLYIRAGSNSQLVLTYSRYFTLEAVVEPNCNLTSNMAYHWSVDGQVTMKNYQMKQQVLVLPPRVLPYGFHSIKVKVEMVGTIVYSSKTVTVEVIPSPLVAKIVGGVYRHLNINDVLIINGSLSFDPDYIAGDTLRYTWRCTFVSEDGNYGDQCFYDNVTDVIIANVTTQISSCNIHMNTSILKIPKECLVKSSNYTFDLMVSSPRRENGSTSQMISLERGSLTSLDVKIVRPYYTQNLVNSNRKLSFYVECSNCAVETTTYQWKIKYLAGYNIFDMARAHDATCVEIDGSNYLALNVSQKSSKSNDTKTVHNDDDDVVEGTDNEDNGNFIDDDNNNFNYDDNDGYNLYEDSDGNDGEPLLPYDAKIEEGTPDSDTNRRPQGRRPLYNDDDDNDDDARYLLVTENKESQRRAPTTNVNVDIVEKETNGGRVSVVEVEEGEPGESGSSSGRLYPITPGTETDRSYQTVDPNEPEDLGSGVSGLDKLRGWKIDRRRQLSQLELPMITMKLPIEQTSTGLDEQSLVIKPGVLKQGLTYFVDVIVKDKITGNHGEATSSFIVNTSPVHGRCSIKPESGTELTSQFTVSCIEWRDMHQPLMLEVSYSFDKDGDRNIIYRGVNNYLPIHLPSGLPDNNYNVYISIALLDGLLAKTSVCSIPVQVLPKIVTNSLGIEESVHNDAKLIYDEVISPDGALQKSIAGGNSALSKAYITYLATWLNRLNDSDTNVEQSSLHTAEYRWNSSGIADKLFTRKSKKYQKDARRELLKILKDLSIRDEAELVQSAKALSITTAVADELDLTALDLALKVLKSVCTGAEIVYNDDFMPTGELVEHVVRTSSAIIQGIMVEAQELDSSLENMLKLMIKDAMNTVEWFVLNELKFHVFMEEPIISDTEYLSIWASRHSLLDNKTMSIGKTQFKIPSNLGTNEDCVFSHMTSYKINPYGFKDRNKVQSVVGGLTLYNCKGDEINVNLLQPDDEIYIDLPNIQSKTLEFPDLILQKWAMNVHQFNVTSNDLHHALHIVIELVPVLTGRLFPISVLLSHMKPPSPEYYNMKYDIEPGDNIVDIFLPTKTINDTGEYFIGIVDSTYNSGRLRPGEVTKRNYTLKLWWGQCLYWNVSQEAWLPDGCNISQDSTLEVTKCSCNHLTTFGGRIQLVPNKLSFTDMEGFFSLNRNLVTLTLVCIVIIIYCILLFLCYQADLHDNRKGGIVYLLDNSPMDQQKFEITVETGFWKGAGSTAKISIILHGEEGMSETRELISEDDRPMFERNSRDKFILSLPDSIGKIWKIQVWHNNFGPSPSWYLSRVMVRDLNTGCQYTFLCEKWLAVEEDDGKVEREFMVLDNTLHFTKIYEMKTWEYMADFHVWLSLLTCPPYCGFMRTERLTVCLTMLMTYMCLNAVWYKSSLTEYRGEFGLLDLSWRNLTVGAICCAVVIPISRLIEFLFRRSKPKHASSCHTKDEATDWEPDYPSGKPNEQESEDSSEQVQPIMTYSLLDQSILNWPNIQTWAQKQWMKRQQSGRSIQDSHSGNSSNHSGLHHGSNGSTNRQGVVNSVDLSVLNTRGNSELDQASSGFEDCSSLIRPKASVDSTHTTAAPSVNESTRVHKPQSLPDSLRISTKLPSESDYVKTSKAPSISSSSSNKSSMLHERRRRILQHLYLPYWCRYIAWCLCGIICVTCATITIMYGYRFGPTKSTLWLQSLYFSMMICVFISNPILILLAVCYSSWLYRNDPNITDNYSYDIFNNEKAKQDLMHWKKQQETWDEGEALERGVAARQRSRYLRFARPPQEKQLIEARKRVLKEKRALTLLREMMTFVVSFMLLFIMAYSKDSTILYNQNIAVKNQFVISGDIKFNDIKSIDQWYTWLDTTFLQSLSSFTQLYDKNMSSLLPGNTYRIGDVQLRQQRVSTEPCSYKLPYVHPSCLGNDISTDNVIFDRNIEGLLYSPGNHGDFMFGKHNVYDGSGYIMSLNASRSEAKNQINILRSKQWFTRSTVAVIVELTLYNVQSNLFTGVKLLAEMSPTGLVFTDALVTSIQLFRYVSGSDNILLACELLFFVLMMISVRDQLLVIISERRKYFYSLWNNISFLIAVISLLFCGCYIYRFVIVAQTVENLRSSYYEKYVSVSFVAFWDNILLSAVAILLFLYVIKSLRLLRFNKQFATIGEIYRKSRREILVFFGMFCVILSAYSCLGRALFGNLIATFSDFWHSIMGVTSLITGSYRIPEFQSNQSSITANVFLFTFCVFGIGFLTSYMVAVLTHQFKVRKKRRLLAFNFDETFIFYWTQLQLWTGLRKPTIEEEPVVILPPEFTMAEIEYQVDELLFRMNALTGSHGLPEKPTCYLTDSDCTYGGGDDGISSAGSETGPVFLDDRLEQRVQKIEDNLCSQEPFLAQLLKFDSIGCDDFTQEKEKQLRSHLELEIFRQLQIQRQDLKSPSEESPDKGSNCETTDTNHTTEENKTPESPGQGSTSSDEQILKQKPISKPTKPRRTRSSLKVQTLQDLLSKSPQEVTESHENSSSNPDSPRDKLAFGKINKPVDSVSSNKSPWKQNSSSSSSEKISPDLSSTHVGGPETENIKKPTKPTFLDSRETSLSECLKGSPILKIRALGSDKGIRSDVNPLGLLESSSGSEQDSLQLGKKLFGRRSLRKTKSRGKGKGPDSLEPALVLDEIEGEDIESSRMEVKMAGGSSEEYQNENHSNIGKGTNNDKSTSKDHVIMADIHVHYTP